MTKDKKIEFLYYALSKYQNYNDGRRVGFCYLLNRFLGEDHLNPVSHFFPELHKYRPDKTDIEGYWFDFTIHGIEKRIKILKTVLNELSKTSVS